MLRYSVAVGKTPQEHASGVAHDIDNLERDIVSLPPFAGKHLALY